MNIEKLAEKAIVRASSWMRESTRYLSDFELKFGSKVKSMLENENDKIILIDLLDKSFRSDDASRSVEQVKHIFSKYGMAKFFSGPERFLIYLFTLFGRFMPALSMNMFVNTLRGDVAGVVLKGESEYLLKHVTKRESEGIRLNLNFIGEAVLGEEEAEYRRAQYVKALETPAIKYISIKASTIYSQISSLGYETTLKAIETHLERVYRAARDNTFKNEKGEIESKFVNLDMEEYRDMEIVYELFMRILDKEEFLKLSAGIVVQAYIPDSFSWLQKLAEWSKKRVARGGAPIKVRIVKGANMEMEYIESSSKHWEMVTYTDKYDTDANYKKSLLYTLSPENAKAVNTGVASHNVFDLAFAYEAALEMGTLEYLQFESLEGMVESIRQTIRHDGQKMVVYGTSAKKENFTNAIAYLVRRLDENTGTKNFLRYSFALKVDSPEWDKLKVLFLESVKRIEKVSNEPTRKQDRNAAPAYQKIDFSKFVSEIDTDFVLPQNRRWAESIRDKWSNAGALGIEAGPVIAGIENKSGAPVKVLDKCVLPKEALVGRYYRADEALLKTAVDTAITGYKEWQSTPFEEKLLIFERALNLFRKNRGELLGVAAAELGKVFSETDVEVSEAIDFIYFYSHAMKFFIDYYPNIKFPGRGVGLVVSPWNFPVAIPTGGIVSSLISGNATLFKPASVATLTGRMLCDIFWEAGVPKNVLQFISAGGEAVEKALVKDDRVDFCIFTGSEATAYKMLNARPDLLLSAETGGKDGTIVSNMADKDQAIKNVLHSAFSNSGQKCSATSLLVLEEAAFNNESFKKILKDAALSMKVGSVWDLSNKMATLAMLPEGNLKKAIETKDEGGEYWLVPPAFENSNPYMMRPAVRWNVKRGSHFHLNELFGPVLSVMKAKDLKDAVSIVNATGYGLTAGFESLDEREWKYFRENLKAGNLYINRGTTGAIVLRQPFGGLRKSAVGLGRKAGTFNYVTQFAGITEMSAPYQVSGSFDELADTLSDLFKINKEELRLCSASYISSAQKVFNQVVDPMRIRGEDNEFLYLKVPEVVIRYYAADDPSDLAKAILAVRSLGIKLTVSANSDVTIFDGRQILGVNFIIEAEERFCQRFGQDARVRYLSKDRISLGAYKLMYAQGGFFAYGKVLSEGRFELLNYVLEQNVSTSYHRYGNLGKRKGEVGD